MLRIGYVRLSDPSQDEPVAALRAVGCQVVRVEEQAEGAEVPPVLASILEFVGQGDELVTPRLEHLGRSPRAVLKIVQRLHERNATLTALDPPISSAGEEGETLRRLLHALANLEPGEAAPRRARAPADAILALQRAGVGPVEIARRLGVSRMTVWRKLRRLEA